MNKTLFFGLSLLLASCATEQVSPPETFHFSKVEDYHGYTYSLVDKDCGMELVIAKSAQPAARQATIKFCEKPFESQLQGVKLLIAYAKKDAKQSPLFSSFACPWYHPDVLREIALMSYEDPNWDRKKGRNKTKEQPNEYAQKAYLASKSHKEFAALLGEVGVKVKGTSIDKVYGIKKERLLKEFPGMDLEAVSGNPYLLYRAMCAYAVE